MFDGSDVTYIYDGSFDGLMSCVFESFIEKKLPREIVTHNEFEPSFFECRVIDTDSVKAQRVKDGIKKKISKQAYYMVCDSFLTCLEQKELLMLKFIILGFERGSAVTSMLGDNTVSAISKAIRHLGMEANHMLGFVRFSVHDNTLVSVIEPNNFLLPKIAPHFCDRFANENFLIYDKAHKAALIYCNKECNIVSAEDFTPPDASDEEYYYRSLWKMFYDTIAIKERENPQCRMSHMAKHYWSHLTELNGDEKKTNDSHKLSGKESDNLSKRDSAGLLLS